MSREAKGQSSPLELENLHQRETDWNQRGEFARRAESGFQSTMDGSKTPIKAGRFTRKEERVRDRFWQDFRAVDHSERDITVSSPCKRISGPVVALRVQQKPPNN